MTTLRLSAPELSDAVIAPLPPRVELIAAERAVVPSTVLEYRVIYVARAMSGPSNDGAETDLNKAARDGWRYVGSLTNDEGRTTGLILERATPTAGSA